MPRSLDIVLSLMALIVGWPVLALVALLNYALTGTVLYRQVRLGRNLQPFTILKFQTMLSGADRLGSITAAGDARVTKVGRVWRALKLDELPQLINVLRGEMNLVGPRALTPAEVAQIPPEIATAVYDVRPGMTGLAALVLVDEERLLGKSDDPISFYYGSILPQKMAWELLYVPRKSAGFDLFLLAATPLAVLFPAATRRMLTRLLGGPVLGDQAVQAERRPA